MAVRPRAAAAEALFSALDWGRAHKVIFARGRWAMSHVKSTSADWKEAG
eukprot:CAMPEP_0183354958 /NCGR_PEP_ID=MMETSP0164_2-20130417/38634_1 /TAXON_ID=221442 /ORGANISM="Coccolithus pelagicus ssp braarudi, Strain PLY182g" /LENGTH=48 /DNA_ID= /DNA_START= /DNA_END= /DNA_ORIENTATION=